ncbi:ATPase associated with various cellular activities AAA_5 [Methanocaldococcus vulcanius M7]|uniref:ATPase associated with various cellular activities AAA_5 n=1 Tax=Methanocaldococcus vulcanius (strain ATCC 700851 / DSM 12094 / M7) TaxID=579137 RepID=C9RHJ6_METVM|nr:AAA family ATPase [Methanocaldococcus vulcanius]ACX73048.1 ATPase associated with various cellular activities AAA_5 [Methanocaldococcus vulcanius M7]
MKKIEKIRWELNSYFLERREEVDVALTSILANEHVVFLGNPGVAKSQLIRAVASHVNADYFEKLITRFTTEDELFGPLSIKELKDNDRFVRKTSGYLPTAEIAFLDEVFKANSSILNALLSIINERLYHNGDRIEKVPLISLFGASNELPEENELLAFYDRFLFRKTIKGIKNYENLKKLVKLDENYKPKTKISVKDVLKMQEKAKKVEIDGIIDYLIDIKKKLSQNHIYISDRRFKKSVKAVKCFAYLNGKKEAEVEDLDILRHVYWEDIEDILIVSKVVFDITNKYADQVLEKAEIIKNLKNELKYIDINKIGECKKDYNKLIEILCKMARIRLELKKIKNEAKLKKRKTDFIDEIIKETDEFNNYIEGILNEM